MSYHVAHMAHVATVLKPVILDDLWNQGCFDLETTYVFSGERVAAAPNPCQLPQVPLPLQDPVGPVI